MGNAKRRLWPAIVAAIMMTTAMQAAPAIAVDDTRYLSVTLRGRLTEPSTGGPMVGATVRFTSTDEKGGSAEALTNDKGEFVLEGLAYGDYVAEIETAEGERIWGINAFPVKDETVGTQGSPASRKRKSVDAFPVKEETVGVTLRISDRVVSSTTFENRPERFAAVVVRQEVDWNRFWREFAIFFGIATGVGVVAL